MNYISYSKEMFERLVKNKRYCADCTAYLNSNPFMYFNREFAFDNGVVQLEGKALFVFFACEYSGEEKSEIGKTGFVIHALSGNKEVVWYFGISEVYYNVEKTIDWYVEPLNEWCKEYWKNLSQEQIIFGYAYKSILVLDQIQRKAIKSKKKIIKVQSDIERKFKNSNGNCVKSSVIRLSDGIEYQYFHEYKDIRPYNRHTEAWEVKGHYRHYKSGKVVFVKPYKKGKGTVNDKEYAITF